MPKKHRNIFQYKPQSTPHPSLSSSRGEASSKQDATPSSVNEILSNLRKSDNAHHGQTALVHPPTMPPQVRQVLQLPETPSPRPRTSGRAGRDANGNRLPAGPAPPKSWLVKSRSVTGQKTQGYRHLESLHHLPGCSIPRENSLVHLCLKKMAEDWDFQSQYNMYYLSSMPTRLRSLLLSYIAVFGPDDGVGLNGLKNIIRPPQGSNAGDFFTGNDNFHRLDLSCAMRSVTFPQLSDCINPHDQEVLAEEEDWELEAVSEIPSNPTYLPCLTHLSLSHPPPNISWTKLINFAKNTPTITHLSLAHFPVPCLTPNSTTATMSHSRGLSADLGGTNFYSHTLDQDWSEAAGILRRLSRELYNLEWLNIDGCTEWAPALHWKESGINWKEHWSKVRFISLKNCYNFGGRKLPGDELPRAPTLEEFKSHKQAIVRAVEVETHIRKERGWITVEHDDWEKYDEVLYDTYPHEKIKAELDTWNDVLQTARFSRHEEEKSASSRHDHRNRYWQ